MRAASLQQALQLLVGRALRLLQPNSSRRLTFPHARHFIVSASATPWILVLWSPAVGYATQTEEPIRRRSQEEIITILAHSQRVALQQMCELQSAIAKLSDDLDRLRTHLDLELYELRRLVRQAHQEAAEQ